jgi:hypothetical protein
MPLPLKYVPAQLSLRLVMSKCAFMGNGGSVICMCNICTIRFAAVLEEIVFFRCFRNSFDLGGHFGFETNRMGII